MAFTLQRLLHAWKLNRSCTRFARAAQSTNQHFLASTSNDRNVISSRHRDCVIPELNVTQQFFESSKAWPERTAIVCGLTGRSCTFDQLVQLSRNFGGSLVKMGFRKGDTIALALPNMPEFPVAFFGAAGIGMTVLPINPSYTPDEITRLVQSSQASAVVTLPVVAETMRQVMQSCPSVKHLVLAGAAEEGCVSMAQMLSGNGHLFPDNIDVKLDEDTLVLAYSSGTTGLPKGVDITNRNVVANVEQMIHPGTTILQKASGPFQEIFMCVLPFFHIYGIVVLMSLGLSLGAKLVTFPRFDPNSFIATIHKYQPTQMCLVPPLVNLLASHPAVDPKVLHGLHTVSSGAAPLSDAIYQKFYRKFDGVSVALKEGYGLTESSGAIHLAPVVDHKQGSVGQLVSRTKAKVVHLETGEGLGPGERGELWVKGPQVMKGYKDNAEATKAALDPSGWLRTGDIAYYDQDGHFFITDRLKELIKVKGFQVSPSELESVLLQHGSIADAAVVGVPDEFDGEAPCAFVVQRYPRQELRQEDVLQFVERKVAPYKRLKGGVILVDSIPKLASGKIVRNQLKQMALSSSK